MRTSVVVVATVLALAVWPAERAAAQEAPPPIEVGVVAPDFAVPGGTRYGILADPVTLSEYAGKTVVLAFFFRARTRG